MKWIAIAGAWRQTNNDVEEEVRTQVRRIISEGNGIVSGGALGVDYIATDETLLNKGKLKIIIPSTLDVYRNHYLKRAEEGVITKEQAAMLITQLQEVRKR